MPKKSNEVIEAEIIDDSGAQSHSYKSYVKYTQRPANGSLIWVWIFNIVVLFMSIIPFVGFVMALVAIVLNLVKKIPPVLPIFSLIISSVVTCFAWLIWVILTAIF